MNPEKLFCVRSPAGGVWEKVKADAPERTEPYNRLASPTNPSGRADDRLNLDTKAQKMNKKLAAEGGTGFK